MSESEKVIFEINKSLNRFNDLRNSYINFSIFVERLLFYLWIIFLLFILIICIKKVLKNRQDRNFKRKRSLSLVACIKNKGKQEALIRKKEKETINKNNHTLLNDLLEKLYAVEKETKLVTAGDLSNVNYLILVELIFELWIGLVLLLPILALLFLIIPVKIPIIFPIVFPISLVCLFIYYIVDSIKKINKEVYLKQLTCIKEEIMNEIDLIEFSKENMFSLKYIDELRLFNPTISQVKVKNLHKIVKYPKIERCETLMQFIVFYSFIVIDYWLLFTYQL